MRRHPYLVAEGDGSIYGFAYASPLNARLAYDWPCETTIYIASEKRNLGIGRALYQELEIALSQMGVLSAYACIACSASEDEFLTPESLRFHESMGYKMVGRFSNCGSKFGRWYDIAWMKRIWHRIFPTPTLLFRFLS